MELQARNIVFERLIKLTEKYPDKDWAWGELSFNCNFTFEMINKYSDKPWDWEFLSQHPKLTIEIINQFKDKPWDRSWNWKNVLVHIAITSRNIDYNHNNTDFWWALISKIHNIKIENIEKYKVKIWN